MSDYDDARLGLLRGMAVASVLAAPIWLAVFWLAAWVVGL